MKEFAKDKRSWDIDKTSMINIWLKLKSKEVFDFYSQWNSIYTSFLSFLHTLTKKHLMV